jgi:hypothetical protein
VWHDLCAATSDPAQDATVSLHGCVLVEDGNHQADGVVDQNEPGIGGVLVEVGAGACPAVGLSVATTDTTGNYYFRGLPAGAYCVSVDASAMANRALSPGRWSWPPAVGTGSDAPETGHTITLQPGEQRVRVNFGWDYQLIPEPSILVLVPTPQPAGLPPAVEEECLDRAAFVKDVTIPDYSRLTGGEPFIKTWRLRNSGTCTWTTDYWLVYSSGHMMGGPIRVGMPGAVRPEGEVDLSVNLIAPTAEGSYEGRWQLRSARGDFFGIGDGANRSFWVRIVVGPALSPRNLVGWFGEYYDNRDLSGRPMLEREDEAINFDWNYSSPAMGIPSDSFSVRWTRVLPLLAGDYRFNVIADDGVRVWLDDERIIDEWHTGSGNHYLTYRELSDDEHTLKVEYYEGEGAAQVTFWLERLSDFGQWRAAFFPNPDLVGAPTLVRNDTAISYNWGSGTPANGLPADDFSVRWTRTIAFDEGRYRFYAVVDDGFRLYVDDTLVLNSWSDGGRREIRAELRLQAGYHSLRAEYYERTGDAQVQLNWERLDIYPDWRAEYWNNPDLQGMPVLVRNDRTVNFVWGSGAPAPNIPIDSFSVRWTRQADFETSPYRFHLHLDGGARLWIDDQLILDAWFYDGERELIADLDLRAGAHALRLEYCDRSGHAEAHLWWEPGPYYSNTR